MNVTMCNKCKKQNPSDDWRLDKPLVNGSFRGQGIGISFDLCEKCGTKLAEYIKKYFGIKGEKKVS